MAFKALNIYVSFIFSIPYITWHFFAYRGVGLYFMVQLSEISHKYFDFFKEYYSKSVYPKTIFISGWGDLKG